jgi:hypothetical protein
MKYIFVTFLVPFWLGTMGMALAGESKLESELQQNRSSSQNDNFDTVASHFVQEQINLITRIENSLLQPDANRVRAVRGQIIVQSKAISGFVKRQDPSFKATCSNVSSNRNNLRSSQAQIYCYLYASSQELLKLSPLLDRILSRRGELALVRELPLVSGERQSDPVLALSPFERPNLAQKATPFAIQEPNLPPSAPPIVGQVAKKTLANYRQPMQSALVIPQEAISTLETAEKLISQAKIGFSLHQKFYNPRETTAALLRFTYDIDQQEARTYQSFLALPKTGIFRVLPFSAYLRPLNTLHNRLLKTVSDRYPFPSWGEASSGFTPNLALMLVEDKFQILPLGIDYNFMVDLGNIPIDKLDTTLKTITPEIRETFLNYQPPKQLAALQSERRRFTLDPSSRIGSTIPARLNHTYLVRVFQFKLSEAIINGKILSPQERLRIDELLKYQSSDTIIAFRPVRQRSDGTYTVVWRLLNQFSAPQIDDLEAYVKY